MRSRPITDQALRRWVQDLPPGAFSFVMATGIVSTAIRLVRHPTLSVALLAVAAAGQAGLLALLIARVSRYPGTVVTDARNAEKAFGFFTLVAAFNVLGVRFDLAGDFPVAVALFAASVPVWVVAGYAIPGTLMLGARARPVVDGVNGSWFLWVVATQSLVVSAASIAFERPAVRDSLVPVAVGLWGVGVVLYLMLVGLVTLRLLAQSSNPHTFSPTYWIYMGATAITVLGGSRILRLPAQLPILHATGAVIAGLTYLLWAFGSWWVPLLLIFGFWRHGLQREPVRYESGLWSMVFPLGMYAVGSVLYGQAEHLPFMVTVGEAEAWFAFAAWVLVAASMLTAAARGLTAGRQR